MTDTTNSRDNRARERFTDIAKRLGKITEDVIAIGKELNEWEEDARADGTIKPSTLGLAFFSTSTIYEELDKAVKKVYHFKDALNKFHIPERLRAYDMDGMRIPEIARSFSIVEKTSASFIDKDAGLDWLRSIEQGDMIQETVNAGTLSAFIRNMILEQGIDPPEDIVKVSTYSTTSMVKYRPKPSEV